MLEYGTDRLFRNVGTIPRRVKPQNGADLKPFTGIYFIHYSPSDILRNHD